MSWADMSEWWLSEIESDPAYEHIVTPLLLDVLKPERGLRYLDVGCGEGRVVRSLSLQEVHVVGLDISEELAGRSKTTIVADLLSIPVREDSMDGAYCVLALEHVEDHAGFFSEVARAVRTEGVLALVVNHPVWTAPDSTPVTDVDGEVLWRPGRYFSRGSSHVPAGGYTIEFHHRTIADLLNAAADSGWELERLIEQPHHEYEDQVGIPRLLAARWRRSG